ncbi:MAG: hypothetical protein ACFFDC_15315 [Promethearchaeota archaeon]
MILYKGKKMIKNHQHSYRSFLVLILLIFTGTVTLDVLANNTWNDVAENSPRSKPLRLMSSTPLSQPEINPQLVKNQEKFSPTDGLIPNNTKFTPTLKIAASYDVTIDKISPEAMEINTSSMEFILNFTLSEAIGQESTALEKLTLNNTLENYQITTWSDWRYSLISDHYSIKFILNNTIISSLSLGAYDLTLYTNVFVGSWHKSNDSILLPMKDLQITAEIYPKQFNNKLDEDQYFNITITVKVDDGTSIQNIDKLPAILNDDSRNVNPNATIISATQEESRPLHFVRFVENSTPEGRFTFEVNLTYIDAPYFEDDDHTLTVTVTTYEGITGNITRFNYFQAKGTVYLVRLKEITIGSNEPLDYYNLTNDGKNHTVFRVNINESISVTYDVIDNSTQSPPEPLDLIAGQLIGYQDPNRPDVAGAWNYSTISSSGNGTIVLTANVLTSSGGYPLLFFVRGHRASQLSSPSNITIFWDLLYYEYTYFDNLGDTGESPNIDQKALGVDIGAWWAFQLTVYYASDSTLARSSQISYHFSNEPWQDLTDGEGSDELDGVFLINRTESEATVLNLSIRIVNGSIIDPQGTLFVNKTQSETSFNISITWTYLIVRMMPQESDKRLGVNTQTQVNITAYWAHDQNLFFTGTLIGRDPLGLVGLPLANGRYIWSGLIQKDTGEYTYEISRIGNNIFGVETFRNLTNGLEVQTTIIWEEIEFYYSQDGQKYHNDLVFFANFNENATLYCYGNHTYDGVPFKGEAILLDFDRGNEYPLNFNSSGIAIWEGNLSDARLPVSFSIYEIKRSTEVDWGVYKVGSFLKTSAKISWDKIVVTFTADQSYSHGTRARIDISLDYLVYSDKLGGVNYNTVEFDILLSNGSTLHFAGGNNTHFFDYSVNPDKRWYNLTSLFDRNTELDGFETRYKWNDVAGMIPKADMNMTICWIDDKPPSILEHRWYDFGNGTIIIIIDVTDNGENWIGSGINKVELFDTRDGDPQRFPDTEAHKSYQLTSGVYRHVFIYRFDQSGVFRFNFNQTLNLKLDVTDNGTLDFPEWLDESKRNSHTVSTGNFLIQANYDPDNPLFIKKNGYKIIISYKNMSSEDLTNITDGAIIVTVVVQDYWAGLNDDSAILVVTDISNRISLPQESMMLVNDPDDSHSEYQFKWEGILEVSYIYSFNITVIDNAGNTNSASREVVIEDHVAPRVNFVSLIPTSDRKLNIVVTIEEKGGTDYTTAGIKYRGNIIKWVNLTYQAGGTGGQATSDLELRNYSSLVTLNFDMFEFITAKSYSLVLEVFDSAGNWKYYNSDELTIIGEIRGFSINVTYNPLIFHPVFYISAGLFLIIGIFVGIRIASKTVGYDIDQILVESDKISRETVLTMMDEYALGMTVNFFDQVQGPVPVIWEPPLLEDQQQIMLDLSDKSFSTLEFVGSGEDERSGTFDFSTGSYDCTALGYSFAITNPAARGGKENLSIVLLLRKEWGENLLFFQDVLLEKIREIRKLIEAERPSSLISKEGRDLREFVSRLMIAFNKMYTDIDYGVE